MTIGRSIAHSLFRLLSHSFIFVPSWLFGHCWRPCAYLHEAMIFLWRDGDTRELNATIWETHFCSLLIAFSLVHCPTSFCSSFFICSPVFLPRPNSFLTLLSVVFFFHFIQSLTLVLGLTLALFPFRTLSLTLFPNFLVDCFTIIFSLPSFSHCYAAAALTWSPVMFISHPNLNGTLAGSITYE